MCVFHIREDDVAKEHCLIPENGCIKVIPVVLHTLHALAVASIVGLESENIFRTRGVERVQYEDIGEKVGCIHDCGCCTLGNGITSMASYESPQVG